MSPKIIAFIKSFAIWFAVFYLAIWAFQQVTGGNKTQAPTNTVTITPVDDTPVLQQVAQFKVKNDTDTPITLVSPCGNPESLKVSRLISGKKLNLSDDVFANCNPTDLPDLNVPAQKTKILSLKNFNQTFFAESGKYVLDAKISPEVTIESKPFTYEEPGLFRKLFRAIITKPLFNLLAFFTQVIPGHSLGWAIIAMTLVVRLILFLPNQKSMKSQRKLQKLQPKIEALKKKHGKNQQALAMATMELYKTEKINPMSSCLPMLLQMPFLIGTYYVVRGGISESQRYLLYPFNQNVDLNIIDPYFFGLDLHVPDVLVLPILVAVAQYVAVKLSFIAANKKKKVSKSNAPAEGMTAQMEQMQKMMLYVMPLMIGFFTSTFPAGVGIYWLTSTIFGIFQQKLVNWQLDQSMATGVVRRVKKSGIKKAYKVINADE